MTSSLRSSSFLLCLAAFTSATAASARPFRVNDIPNGAKYGCLNCHGDNNASYNTDFGGDARLHLVGAVSVQQQNVDWAPLCPIDSDRDGWTNGEELGDPDCTWKKGDPDPMGFIYNPGNPDNHPPPVCGSGELEGGEACDGDLFLVTDCAEIGAGEGKLGCTDDCKLDDSACSQPPGSVPDLGGDGSADEAGGCSAAPGQGRGLGGLVAAIGGLFAAAALRRKNRR
ncbi:hypothetical protein [Polyangium spumosum]|uniref:Temptin Cys/Cys disulfide domain-containing protein n=1 Tax=Polyangium spumosum TaxID=889282 RepID=A0A6N7PXH5_9BACT|nr:hypothetical protein [Polyangium spumosum]MRG96589.1 hypothetical protein [Polyangium spumosum]